MTGLFKKNIKWFEEHGIISSECFDKLEKKPKTYGHLLPDFSIWENREQLRNMFHDAVVSQRTTLFEKLAVEEKKEKKMTNTEFVQHKHDFAKSIMRNLENYIGAPLPWDECKDFQGDK